MRALPCLWAATAASAMLACDRQSDTFSPTSPDVGSTPAGFVTSLPAQARALLPKAVLKPIITVGDPIPGQESNTDPEQRVWAPIPDGLGAYQDGSSLVLFANHEIASAGVDGKFTFARVSRLLLDPATLSVTGGSYPITGKVAGSMFQRLCSATFAGVETGFGQGWFFTGEESVSGGAQGIQLAVKHDGSDGGAHAKRRHGHLCACIASGNGSQPVVLRQKYNFFELCGQSADTGRITDQDHPLADVIFAASNIPRLLRH